MKKQLLATSIALAFLSGCSSTLTKEPSVYPSVDLQEDLFLKNLPESLKAGEIDEEESDWTAPVEKAPHLKSNPLPKVREIVSAGEESEVSPNEVTAEIESEEEEAQTVADSEHEALPMYETANRAMVKHDYELAIRLFREFSNLFPDHLYSEGAELKVAECYAEAGDRALANLLYENWLQKHPDSLRVPEALVLRARNVEQAGDPVKAKKIYREVLEQFAAEPEALTASRRLAELSKEAKNARQ